MNTIKNNFSLKNSFGSNIFIPSAPAIKSKSTNLKQRVWSPKTITGFLY